MRKQKLLPLLLLFLAFCGKDAIAKDSFLKVNTRDGNSLTITLPEFMQASFFYDVSVSPSIYHLAAISGEVNLGENNLPIQDPDNADGTVWFDLPVPDIKDLQFVDVNGLEAVTKSRIDLRVQDAVLAISGLNRPTVLTVSRTDGTTVMSQVIKSDFVTDLSVFGNGIYCVTIGETSFKVMVKK